MTTNALGWPAPPTRSADAGLDRVNVSLDTRPAATLPRRSPAATGCTTWSPGLAAAAEAGLGPVKVNAVLLRGVNDDQAPELLRWCLDHGYELRFIEQMPLDAQHGWSRDRDGHRRRDLRQRCEQRVRADARPTEPRGSAPAELFLVDGGPATVGVIASVTRPFCGDCDRVRLTADGQVRNCLFAREESDLRTRAARRRHRRGDRRPLGGRDGGQARRPRHRRPAVPAARPADVGHRRLSDSLSALGPVDRGLRPPGTTSRRKPRAPRKSRERLAVLVARQPGLAAVRRVQLGVVPDAAPRRPAPGSPWRSRSSGRLHGPSGDVRDSGTGDRWCRTATGEAVRHRRRIWHGVGRVVKADSRTP